MCSDISNSTALLVTTISCFGSSMVCMLSEFNIHRNLTMLISTYLLKKNASFKLFLNETNVLGTVRYILLSFWNHMPEWNPIFKVWSAAETCNLTIQLLLWLELSFDNLIFRNETKSFRLNLWCVAHQFGVNKCIKWTLCAYGGECVFRIRV